MLQRSRGQRRRRVRLWAGVGTSAAEPLWRGAHKAATSLPRSLATIAESPADRVRLEAEVPKTSAPRGRRFDKFQRVSDLRRPVTVSGWRFETVYARRIVPRTNKRLIYACATRDRGNASGPLLEESPAPIGCRRSWSRASAQKRFRTRDEFETDNAQTPRKTGGPDLPPTQTRGDFRHPGRGPGEPDLRPTSWTPLRSHIGDPWASIEATRQLGPRWRGPTSGPRLAGCPSGR